MSQPDVNSPTNGSLLLPWAVKIAAMSCLLPAIHRGGVALGPVYFRCARALSSKSLTSLSLSRGSSFGLEAGQAQGVQACGVQPNTCQLGIASFWSFLSPGLLSRRMNSQQWMWLWKEHGFYNQRFPDWESCLFHYIGVYFWVRQWT